MAAIGSGIFGQRIGRLGHCRCRLVRTTLQDMEPTRFRAIFIAAALWNLAGGLPGYFDSPSVFYALFGAELSDPLMISVYRGAWGTTFLYFVGYLIVARNPGRHTGIVLLGTIGKVFFAANLLNLYAQGLATSLVLVVVAGDSVFSVLFVLYLLGMRRHRLGLL